MAPPVAQVGHGVCTTGTGGEPAVGPSDTGLIKGVTADGSIVDSSLNLDSSIKISPCWLNAAGVDDGHRVKTIHLFSVPARSSHPPHGLIPIA